MNIILACHNSKTKTNYWNTFKSLEQLKYKIFNDAYIKSLLKTCDCSGVIVQLNRYKSQRLSIESIINTPYVELNNLLQCS